MVAEKKKGLWRSTPAGSDFYLSPKRSAQILGLSGRTASLSLAADQTKVGFADTFHTYCLFWYARTEMRVGYGLLVPAAIQTAPQLWDCMLSSL